MTYNYDRRPITIRLEVSGYYGREGILKLFDFFKELGKAGETKEVSCDNKHVVYFEGALGAQILGVRLNGKDASKRDYKYERPSEDVIEVEVTPEALKPVLFLLHLFKLMGGWGCTQGFSCDGKFVAEFDGDGSDRIKNLEVNGEKVEYTEEDHKRFEQILH